MNDPITESRETILRREQAADARRREFMALVEDSTALDQFIDAEVAKAEDELLWGDLDVIEDDAGEDEGPTEFEEIDIPPTDRVYPPKDRHLAVLQEVAELTKKKRAGYAPGADPFANFRMSQMFGVHPLDGILVRMTDKLSRVASLRSNPANDQVGETIRETLMDLGNYAFIGVAFMDEEANR